MNSLVEEEFPLPETQKLRYDLMNALTDSNLAYRLPGDNPSLGELCLEMGEIEQAYIDSFKTLQQDWSYRNNELGLASSVGCLTAWYLTLDEEFEIVLREFSEDDLHQKEIGRGHGFSPSPFIQFQIYREALLMFYAKASVSLKALQIPVSDQWQSWIG